MAAGPALECHAGLAVDILGQRDDLRMQQVQSFDEPFMREFQPAGTAGASRTPAQGRGRNGPLVIADLAPHPDFIRGPRVFADNLDFIIDPGQLRPEFFGGHPPRIQFGPPPDRLPFARGEVRIQPERPEKGFRHRNQLVHIPAGGKVAGSHQAIVERNGRFIIMVIYGYQPDAFPFAQQTLFPIPLHQIPVPVPRTGFHGRPQGGNADVQFDTSRSLVPRQDFRFAEHADKGVADKLFRKGGACPVAVRTAAAVQNIARLYFVLVFAGVAAERDRRRIVYIFPALPDDEIPVDFMEAFQKTLHRQSLGRSPAGMRAQRTSPAVKYMRRGHVPFVSAFQEPEPGLFERFHIRADDDHVIPSGF